MQTQLQSVFEGRGRCADSAARKLSARVCFILDLSFPTEAHDELPGATKRLPVPI